MYYSCSSIFPTHSCKLCILVFSASAISNLVDRCKLLVVIKDKVFVVSFVSLDVVHEAYGILCVCLVSRIALHLTVVT